MITAPPIQAPFTTDDKGKLTSSTWIFWLQGLASNVNLEEMFSGIQNFQSTDSSVAVNPVQTSNDAEILCWMSF